MLAVKQASILGEVSVARAPRQLDETFARQADELGRLRIAVARLSRRLRLAGAGAGTGLTPSQQSVLGTVVREGPLGLATLAEREGLHPTLLSRIVGALEQAGLVKRSAQESDRRCIAVAATAVGRRLHSRERAARTAELQSALAQLSPSDAASLLAALPALETLAGVGSTRSEPAASRDAA